MSVKDAKFDAMAKCHVTDAAISVGHVYTLRIAVVMASETPSKSKNAAYVIRHIGS